MKKWLPTFLKLLFVIGIGWYLIDKGHFSLEATQSALSQPKPIALSLLCLLGGMLFAFIRWHLLLRAQEIDLSWTRTLQLTWVGHFFNMSLPGAVSGDVVKAIYVGREVPGKRARALSSILFDRLAGVSGLILMALIAMLMGLGNAWSNDTGAGLKSFVLVSGLGMIVFYGYLFLIGNESDPFYRMLQKLKSRNKLFNSVEKIYSGIRVYRNQKSTVAISLLLSLIIHFFVVSACFQLLHALGMQDLEFFAVASIVPLGLLVTAIPITPGGMGTGHLAFAYLFGLLGEPRGADAFNLYFAGQLSLGLLGGLVYLQFKSRVSEKIDFEKESSQLTF